MAFGQDPFNPSRTLPTLAPIQQRRRELLAYQAGQEAAQALATPNELHTDEDTYAPEEVPVAQEQEEQQQTGEPGTPRRRRAEPGGSSPDPPRPYHPPSHAAALYGVAGLVVRSLAPQLKPIPPPSSSSSWPPSATSSAPPLTASSGSTRHGLNLFVVLVGESSKARKGTSWRQIAGLFAEADPLGSSRRVTTARPTPNSILHALRDQQPATDRRLFLLSEEFASVLHVARPRDRPALSSAPLRLGWRQP